MTLPDRAAASGVLVEGGRAPARPGALRFAGASHPGLMRERNEDRLHLDPGRGLLVVVDGMGGEAAGEVAAETALGCVVEALARGRGDPERRVREAIAAANDEVSRRARENPEWRGMGCVLTLALIERGVVTVGHVGDSRAYRLRGGRLDKLTHDHSPVGEREDEGLFTERDAMRHPRRNEVYRSLGAAPRSPDDPDFIELRSFPLERGDAVLLCSDGLTDVVASEEILRVVRAHAADERALVQRLVDAANAAGGKDNITVAFAAGDRFAAEFVRLHPGPAARSGPVSREARGEAAAEAPRDETRRDAPPAAALRGRWAFFALGVLAGVALTFGVRLLEPRLRPQPLAGPEAPVVRMAARHEVGPGRAFRAIGDALAAARPGDTVVVHPGRYREAVRLEEGVTLMAAEPGRAVVSSPLPAEGAGLIAAVVAEGIGSGRIIGIAIAGEPGAPLDYGLILRRSAVTAENVEVRGARLAGVAIEDAGSAALVASHVHDNPGAGILVRGRGTPELRGNRLARNGGGSPPAPGVDVGPGARPVLVGNVIAASGAEDVRGLPTGYPRLDTNTFGSRR